MNHVLTDLSDLPVRVTDRPTDAHVVSTAFSKAAKAINVESVRLSADARISLVRS